MLGSLATSVVERTNGCFPTTVLGTSSSSLRVRDRTGAAPTGSRCTICRSPAGLDSGLDQPLRSSSAILVIRNGCSPRRQIHDGRGLGPASPVPSATICLRSKPRERIMRSRVFISYSRPRLIDGMARIIDLGCTYDKRARPRFGRQLDVQAIRLDWSGVSRDIREAMGEFEDTELKELTPAS